MTAHITGFLIQYSFFTQAIYLIDKNIIHYTCDVRQIFFPPIATKIILN